MDKQWKKYVPPVCGVLGAALLALTVAVCAGLDQGGRLDRLGVGAVLVLFAALAAAVLKLEGFGRDAVLIMLLPIGASMLVRSLCLDYISGDYSIFLSRWCSFFRLSGGFQAFSYTVGNYNMPYVYFVAFISYIDVPDLYLYKLFSILWDVLLAWGCLRLTRTLTRERQGSIAPLIAFGAALFLPTVVLNGAYWAQCDAIYGALCIHAASLLMEGKNKTSVALMAVAFSFKLQAVFILPLWGVLWLAKRVKFRELWVFPPVYFLTILPALLMGKPLKDILAIYLDQASSVSYLVLGAPSVYQFVPRDILRGWGEGYIDGAKIASGVGILLAAALVLALLALGFRLRDKLDRDIVMTVAVLLCIGVPFFLPHMHERYFFLADLFTLCWACSNVRRLPVPILVCGASLASYAVYFRGGYNFILCLGSLDFGMAFEAAAMLAALIITIRVLAQQLDGAGQKRAAME